MPAHTHRISLLSLVGVFIGIGCLVMGWILLERPVADQWGTYLEPAGKDKVVTLTQSNAIRQTLPAEFGLLSGVLVEVVNRDQQHLAGELLVVARHDDKEVAGLASLSDTFSSGELFVPLPSLELTPGEETSLIFRLSREADRVQLRMQHDATKFPNGKLFQGNIDDEQPAKPKAGHLGMRVHYRATGLEVLGISSGSWALGMVGLVLALAIFWRLLKNSSVPTLSFRVSGIDVLVGCGLAVGIFLFVSMHLEPNGALPANADMAKDMLYLQSTVAAVSQGYVPHWHHLSCGGQPLAGNAETGVGGIGTVLALMMGPVIGLKVTLAVEFALAALGMYALARSLKLHPSTAVLPAVVFVLGGYLVNRVFLGHTMFIGGAAFLPWLLLAGVRALRYSPLWILPAALFGALAFARGDTHLVTYGVMALIVISILYAVARRSIKPIMVLVVIVASMAGFGLVKALPVIEGQIHFRGSTLPEFVVPLIEQKRFVNVFVDDRIYQDPVDVRNGEAEGWENVGAFTGHLALVLALVGAFVAPVRYRWYLVALVTVFVVVGEGSIYDTLLRDYPYVGQILRLPSRVLVIAIMAGGLLGAFTVERFRSYLPRPAGTVLAAAMSLLVFAEVSQYATQTLSRQQFIPPAVLEEQAGLHGSVARADMMQSHLHPITLAQSGALLPGACQDFNQPAPFTVEETLPVAESDSLALNTTVSPNTLVVRVPTGVDRIAVRTVDSPLLSVEGGMVAPLVEQEGPLLLLAHNEQVTLRYQSNVLLASSLLSLGFLVIALALVGNALRQTNTTQK